MVKNKLDDVFGSLADPTRRDMLTRLLTGELTINELAQAYDMSLPAVSKHVKVLESAKLITKERRGRQHFIRLDDASIQNATDHLMFYQTVLGKRLDSLSSYLENGEKTLLKKRKQPTAGPKQTLTVTHVFNAPREHVWDTYIKPEHISRWWGPEGIVLPLEACYNDVRVDGIWRFVCRDVEGGECILSGKYKEVIPGKRRVYSDGFGEVDSPRLEAEISIDFKDLSNGRTQITKKSTATQATHQLHAVWLKAALGQLKD